MTDNLQADISNVNMYSFKTEALHSNPTVNIPIVQNYEPITKEHIFTGQPKANTYAFKAEVLYKNPTVTVAGRRTKISILYNH